MNKGIFFIPIYNKNFPLDQIMEEIHENCIKAERNNINEVFFGEHITDKFEKISSSLMMVSMFSKITKKIKLATLTTNLNLPGKDFVGPCFCRRRMNATLADAPRERAGQGDLQRRLA